MGIIPYIRQSIFYMKKFGLALAFLAISTGAAFGKGVDENMAKTIGYNYFKTIGTVQNEDALTSTYKATSVVNGAAVTDFYVFNIAPAGFVMVAGDDNVTPILAYSTESSFLGTNIPSNVADWLNNYTRQINFSIQNNTVPSATIVAQWSDLGTGTTHRSEAKTTATSTPLLHSLWNQSPLYNALCPYDAGSGLNAVTGCVATAMAQVMRYWKWPVQGTGSNSYYASSFGYQSANFGETTYLWDSMKYAITAVDTQIAIINYQAGVSVNMDYGVEESSAFVNIASSPITNCAEYALQTYFSYNATTIHSIFRYDYTDSDWVHAIQAEITAKRPVIYSGFGPQGGHCFVADGMASLDRIHFNWGWGGYFNGLYYVNKLDPAADTFNDGQSAIIGIMPDTMVTTAVTPVVAAQNVSVYPNPANDVVYINLNATKVSNIRIVDMAGREVANITPTKTLISVPTNELVAGIYFVQLHTASGMLTKKITIER